MAFHLIIDVEELIQGVEQHLWSVALMQNVLVLQSAVLHGGRVKACDALRLTLPVLLCSEGECPPKPPLEYGHIITAPVDVFVDTCQHGAPLAIPRQLWPTPYQQGPIVYSPSEAHGT